MTHQAHLLPVADVISAGAILGAFAGALPPIAAFIAIIWYCLEIYESKTIQGFIRNRAARHRLRKIKLRRLTSRKPKNP